MQIARELLYKILLSALEIFFEAETDLIVADVNERTLCGRLANYLEQVSKTHHLTGYFADADYNRNQGRQVKTILNDKHEVIKIICDVILHSRGKKIAQDNLIAIEMKKSTRSEQEKQSDRNRLRVLTKSSYDGIWSADGTTLPEHVCGYCLGVFIEIDIGKRTAYFDFFEAGEQVSSSDRMF